MNNIKKYDKSIFENIKHIDENGNEYWSARELQKVLEYTEWRTFNDVIEKAKINCLSANNTISNDFVGAHKIVKAGATIKKIIDYQLSRYACYLIALNADPRKKVIALAKNYFIINTRKQELLEEEYNLLSEDEKRIYQRNLTKKGNYSLNITAKNAGVKSLSKFHNAGYKGLYNGETANDIYKRKKLRYREDILDNMGSDELIMNLFRISQTNQKLIKDKTIGANNANKTHYTIGKNIRETIIKNGGILPENLPTPKKSIKELEKENKHLENK